MTPAGHPAGVGVFAAPGPAAPPPPPLLPGSPPIAILVDYDGTIALTDVSDAIMAEFVTEEWEAKAAEYDAGLAGSRRIMEWEVGLITAPPEALRSLAAAQPHDAGFPQFVRRARAAGIPVEVVSDGFGFFIEPALEALGVCDVPVVTAATSFPPGARPRIEFPNGHPRCFVCGTCKRARVLAHQATGRAVVFVGDGASDRFAAGYADLVFAKHALLRLCAENGWPYRRWTEFLEIDAWLAGIIDAWRADADSPLVPRPTSKPLYCGPEVWARASGIRQVPADAGFASAWPPSPALPVGEVLERQPAALERGRADVRQRPPHRDHADRVELVGEAEQRLEGRDVLGTGEARGQPGVVGGQHHDHRGLADVDPPVGRGPVDLLAPFVELVRLPVATVIDLLADTRDELGRAVADPCPCPGRRRTAPRRSRRRAGAAPGP